MTRPPHRFLRWLAVVAWAGVIFAGSSVPGSRIPGGYSQIGHFGEYGVLGGLLYFALRGHLDRTRAAALALIVASLYGVSDEFHQHFVVLRTPDVADWALDTVGSAVGVLVTAVVEATRTGASSDAGDQGAAQ